MIFVAYGHGRIQGDRMRGMHPPPANFKNVFDVNNFSIILNLFDSDKSFTSEARIIKNVRVKCILFEEALKIRV